ncbi:MAG: helix-turn-helix domain-containing protein [Macromonas sp.]
MTDVVNATTAVVATPDAPPAGAADAAAAGALLKQAREQAGMSLETLAARVKVLPHKLAELEAGRFEALPDLTFARALAKTICRQFNIDPVPVLAGFPATAVAAASTALDRQTLGTPLDTNRGLRIHGSGRNGLSIGAPVFALAAVAVAAALWWWLPASQPHSGTTTEVATPDTPHTTVEVVPALNQGREPEAATAPPVAVPSPAPVVVPAVTASAVVPPVAGTLPGASSAAVAPSGAEVLQLQARKTTWIEITGGNGRTLLQRTLQAGETVSFSAGGPFGVVVGRADAIEVQVRGQAFDITPHKRNNVARFSVQ